MAEAARRRAQLGDEKATQEYVNRLGELAQQSLKEMRLLVYELQPTAFEKGGLVGAIQSRLDAVERRSGIQARLFIEGNYQLPADVQVQFYRVAEEALNNALKHSGASAIRIRIRSSADSVMLEIEDNGRGFDPRQSGVSGGLGLVSISERVDNLGGHFELKTAPGKGTVIRVYLDTRDGNNGQTDSNTDL
jgi:signal transduction histidine kinase